MFPTVRVSFRNLPDGCRFLVLLDIVPCDNKRYRYAYHRSAWLVAGKADPAPPHRLYCHPDAPFSAEQLKKQVFHLIMTDSDAGRILWIIPNIKLNDILFSKLRMQTLWTILRIGCLPRNWWTLNILITFFCNHRSQHILFLHICNHVVTLKWFAQMIFR